MQESNRKDLVPRSEAIVIIDDNKHTLANVLDKAMQSNLGFLKNMKKGKIIAEANLKALKHEIETALAVSEHRVVKNKEAAICAIDIDAKITIKRITNVYEKWLKEVGIEQSLDTVKFLMDLGEKAEMLKVEINQNTKANTKQKKMLTKILDQLWDDICHTLFKDAAEKIQDECDN